MDHDHKSLGTTTTGDLRLGQYDSCRDFYTAQGRGLEENLGETAGGPVNQLLRHP
jgi:hypothetical protein